MGYLFIKSIRQVLYISCNKRESSADKKILILFIKIVLFMAVMLLVAKSVPYNGLVQSVIERLDYQSASAFTQFILGEPAPEVWETIGDYISFLINLGMSVPVMSIIVTFFRARKHAISPAVIYSEWARSTLRRFAKVSCFTFLFWALFRLLPYPYIFPDQTYSNFTVTALFGFQLFLTVICYWYITTKIIMVRGL